MNVDWKTIIFHEDVLLFIEAWIIVIKFVIEYFYLHTCDDKNSLLFQGRFIEICNCDELHYDRVD